MGEPKKFEPTSVVAVHTNPHHADDVFCAACVLIMNPDTTIIRTRDPEQLAHADFRIDVGGRYDPTTGDYDHHQPDFEERHDNPNPKKYKVGPKLAGFGLLWRHYYKEIIDAILDKTIPNWDREESSYDHINTNMLKDVVCCLDAMDNGEQRTYHLDTSIIRVPSIIRFIQNYNPCLTIDGNDYDRFFFEAVDIAKKYLTRCIIKLYGQVQSIKPVLEAVSKAKDGYLILEQYYYWSSVFSKYPYETKDIKMVIYPSTEGWMFQSPYIKPLVDEGRFLLDLPNGERRKCRYLTPSYLCGATPSEVEKITGVKDCVFIHVTGFVGVCRSIEGTLELAKYIVEHQEF